MSSESVHNNFIGGLYIIRHGAREPLKKDNINLYKNWKHFNGNLTEIGQTQTKILGKYFSKKLKKFKYHDIVFYLNSSEKRTKDTRIIFLKEISNKKKEL